MIKSIECCSGLWEEEGLVVSGEVRDGDGGWGIGGSAMTSSQRN